MKYKTFKEFYWKNAIWSLGIPWGLLVGLITVISEKKEVLDYFLDKKTIITLFLFILAGFLFAYLYGKSLWKRAKAFEAKQSTKL